MTNTGHADVPDWLRARAGSRRFGEGDVRGTANLIDTGARSRAAACMRTGESVSLARPLLGADYNSTPSHPGVFHETWRRVAPDGITWNLDHVVLNPHGLRNTHLDALNHVVVDGTVYGGRPIDDVSQGTADVLAPHGLVTRAVYVNIPGFRGTDWADRPVDGADIDGALGGAGIVVESGDALCLDMGRDRFEASTGQVLGRPDIGPDAGGGLSTDGARWVAEHNISVLAWDMLDSQEATEAHASAHILTWAIGLLLLDNCDFAALRARHGPETKVAGALVVSWPAIEGANGVNVNPIVIS